MRVVRESLVRHEAGEFASRITGVRERFERVTFDYSMCVLSFSEVADDLSQWRAYSHGGGFAIGMNPDVAMTFGTHAHSYFMPVCYRGLEQAAAADQLVQDLIDRFAEVTDEQWSGVVDVAMSAFGSAAVSLSYVAP